ncbi:hypothetical protein AYY18_17085 [Morganella psychrotolerans]|uniref:Uncharacterized protein n=1 Tax=Morganella psychrotolerans TaxID=368603 RepID=A0A1B8HRJ7_9GAMM|nr:hypothetical protein AYY18_17085 [Morganella psychrotolerans]
MMPDMLAVIPCKIAAARRKELLKPERPENTEDAEKRFRTDSYRGGNSAQVNDVYILNVRRMVSICRENRSVGFI